MINQEVKKIYAIAVSKDSNGIIKEIIEIKNVNEEKFKQLKTEASGYLAIVQLKEDEQKKKEKAMLKRIAFIEEQNILLKKAICELAGLDFEALDENIKSLIGE